MHRTNGKNKSSDDVQSEVGQSRLEERHFAPPPNKGRVNVGETERLASLVAGGMMAAFGLQRGSLILLGLGAGLIYRGFTGHCSLYHSLGVNTDRPTLLQPRSASS
jgi:uncharacterized membrane protein